MIDYTSAAKEADRYLNEGGPAYSASVAARLLDPKAAHAHAEALCSLCDEPPAPLSLTDSQGAQDAARTAAQAEQDRLEGRILTSKTPAHLNPHD